MKEILAEIAATSWQDWLKTIGEFTSMVVIVCAIALLAYGFAPC